MTPAREVGPRPPGAASSASGPVVPAVPDIDGSTLRISDASTLRALANPLRMRILGRLRADGPATIGALALATQTAAGSVSFHVRTLAQHGFVVEVPELARDRREHWWAATTRTTSWDPAEFQGSEDGRTAATELERMVLRSQLAMAEEALDHRPHTDPGWVAAGGYGDDRLVLTLAEARELRADLDALMARWRSRADAPDRDPQQETAPVRVVVHSYRAAP